MKKLIQMVVVLLFVGCASKPILDVDDIKVTRDEPRKSCKSLGPIEVRSLSVKPDEKKLMEDLKQEARKKGMNFIQVETLGAQGTAIRGQGFSCL